MFLINSLFFLLRGAREAKKELDSLVYGLISDRRQQQESKMDKGYDDLLSRLMKAQDSNMAGSAAPNGGSHLLMEKCLINK